jgi:hypothetical protein
MIGVKPQSDLVVRACARRVSAAALWMAARIRVNLAEESGELT